MSIFIQPDPWVPYSDPDEPCFRARRLVRDRDGFFAPARALCTDPNRQGAAGIYGRLQAQGQDFCPEEIEDRSTGQQAETGKVPGQPDRRPESQGRQPVLPVRRGTQKVGLCRGDNARTRQAWALGPLWLTTIVSIKIKLLIIIGCIQCMLRQG